MKLYLDSPGELPDLLWPCEETDGRWERGVGMTKRGFAWFPLLLVAIACSLGGAPGDEADDLGQPLGRQALIQVIKPPQQ